MDENTSNTEEISSSETSSGCGCWIIIIIAAIVFFYLKGCDSDESEKNEISSMQSAVNDYSSQYEDNSDNSRTENEYMLKAKEAGIPFVSNFEYIDNIKALHKVSYDNMDGIIEALYYTFPPVYDFFMKMENMNQAEFADVMSTLSKEMGASVSEAEMIEYYYKNMDVFEFNESKNEFVSNIKQQSFNIAKESKGYSELINDNDIAVSKFIKEEYLSADELAQINGDLVRQLNEPENSDSILKAFNIDIYSYKAEKGYKLFFNRNGEEQIIKAYYMNGDWRFMYSF